MFCYQGFVNSAYNVNGIAHVSWKIYVKYINVSLSIYVQAFHINTFIDN